jgi:adenylate kinase family enzyme
MPNGEPIRAILLIGPTGSGKSPQGELLERGGGFRHFDLGAELRAAADGQRGFSEEDRAFVRGLLDAHALLPDGRFGIAAKLLDAFLGRTRFDAAREVLVLNGLPRHVGQALAIAGRVRVEHVVVLECDAAAVRARVARRRRGEGLDHAGRTDDTPEAIERKLAVFERETAPLVAHYAAQPGVRISRLRVTAETDDAELSRRIRRLCAGLKSG